MRLVTQSGGEPNCTEYQGCGHNSWANVPVTASARHGARSDAPQLRKDTSPYVVNVVGEAFFITAMISVPDANHFDPARLPRPLEVPRGVRLSGALGTTSALHAE